MEGGLLRDIFSHEMITLDHWNALMLRPFFTREQLTTGRWANSDVVVTPTYDPHCANGEISNGCEPVEVISADKLIDYDQGKAETTKIATALLADSRPSSMNGTGYHVIGQKAWDCIWGELIQHKKGPKTIYDRPGNSGKNLCATIDQLFGRYFLLCSSYFLLL